MVLPRVTPTPDPDPGAATPAADASATVHHYFEIRVVDAASKAPIAGAQLKTTNQVTYTSDRNGKVAFYEPGLMDTNVYFWASRSGFEIPADMFGNRGKSLKPVEGGVGEIAMNFLSASTVADPGDLQTRLLQKAVPGAAESYAIRVVDPLNHRGVPLVFLKSGSEEYVTDSQGYIAYSNPDRMNTAITFAVSSHGYEYPGGTLTLTPKAGGHVDLNVNRLDIAERLYRITGQGIYRESLLLGLTAPTVNPVINGLVIGQDTVATVPYKGKLFWIWGDTDRAAYPLGNFNTSAARSDLPGQGGLDPRLGLNTNYFTNSEGFARGMFEPIEPTGSPTWLGTLVTLPDANGEERLFGVYSKPNGDLSTHELGLTRFDDGQGLFLRVGVTYPLSGTVVPGGQPIVVRQVDQSRAYFGTPMRVKAQAESLMEPSGYEVFSAMGAQASGTLEKGSDGLPAYGWKSAALDTTEARLSAAGFGKEFGLTGHLKNSDTGRGIAVASIGQAWNGRRGRFVRAIQEMGGSTSAFGEVWYAEGDTPLGPWVYARKIVTHNDYTLYNVWMHPYFQREGGRYIFFEGTYTKSFAGSTWPLTPRYNYNQQMYRLDLEDERVMLPVPVYDLGQGAVLATKRKVRPGSASLAAAFFAPDQAATGVVPAWWSAPEGASRKLMIGGTPLTPPVFYVLDPASANRPSNAVALYEYMNASGLRAYGVDAVNIPSGYTKGTSPIAYVWASPLRVKLPVADFLGDLVAVAGADQTLTEATKNAGADVSLDASSSRNLAGNISKYTWRKWGTDLVLATGKTPKTHLAAGLNVLELEVLDGSGNSAVDTVIIQVKAAP